MPNHPDHQDLPEIIQQYIKRLARRTRNRHMRADITTELRAHFIDALADAPQDCDPHEFAASLIADFGDAKTLSQLIKRAKKRCRPFWVRFTIRTCQTVLALLLIFAGYTYWFVTGQPTFRVDYWAKLNEFSRPTDDESLNAAPHYLSANEMFVEFELDYDWNKRQQLLDSEPDAQERQALERWIESNSPAMNEVRFATAKPYCWFEYASIPLGQTEPGLLFTPSSTPPLTAVTLPYLTNLRQLAEILSWQMQFAAEKGDWDSVITDLRSAQKLTSHLLRCPSLIEQLAGVRVDQQANNRLIHLLRSYPLPTSILQHLAQSFSSDYQIISIDGEAMGHMDAIQWIFTDDGSGNGHMIPGQLIQLGAIGRGDRDQSPDMEEIITYSAGSMIHSSRRKTVELFEQWKRKAQKYYSATPYQNHVSGHSLSVWTHKIMKENPRNFLFNMLVPALQRAAWISYAGQAQHHAAQTIVALLRYKANHDQFPQTLNELVPQYLTAVPLDPFGPGPLTYKPQANDFILYSRGLNFQDNAGQHNKEVFYLQKADGDFVFWPPPPIKKP